MGTIIVCGVVGIAVILIIYLPYLTEKKRQEEHQREIEEVKRLHDEWAIAKLRANLMALESEMMRGEKMRLIDADKLKRVVMSWENPFNAPATYNRVRVITAINEAPTVVRAEPVVRCEECKYFKFGNGCFLQSVDYDWEEQMYANDFCSRGEKKDE